MDGRTWQVVAHGKIRPPIEVDEASCQIFLAEAGWDDKRYDASPPPMMKSVWLGLGQLLFVPVGSCWCNGAYSERDAEPPQEVEVTGANQILAKGKLGDSEPHKRGQMPWTPAYPASGCEDLPLFRISTADGGALWVSPLEVAKATFGVSSEWLRLMVEGGMDVHPDDRRHIIDLKGSYRLESDPAVLRLNAHRLLGPRDLLAAARICSDERMRESFDEVARHLQRQNFSSAPAHVNMPFPFERTSIWKIRECWVPRVVKGEIKKFRLVTHISSISYDLKIDRIELSFPAAVSTQGSDEPTAEAYRRRFIPNPELDDQLNVVTGVASWAPLGIREANTSDNLPPNPWIVEYYPIEDDAKRRSKAGKAGSEPNVGIATTAHHGSKSERGGVNAIRLNAVKKVQVEQDVARSPTVRIASTLSALEIVSGVLQREWQMLPPEAGCGADSIDGLWRYPSSYRGKTLTWAATRDGRPRRALVARLASPQGWIYIVEAEHIDLSVEEALLEADRENRETWQDGYSALGLVLVKGGLPITTNAILSLLALQAKDRGVWRQASFARPVERVRRSKLWSTEYHAYSRGIVSAIEKLESRRS